MTACSGQQEPQKPNIIYIMCDDLGYNDLACYGQQYINTPNLDRIVMASSTSIPRISTVWQAKGCVLPTRMPVVR